MQGSAGETQGCCKIMLAVCGGRQKGKKRSLRGHPAPGRELAARCISAKLSLFPILQQPCYQLTVSIEGKKNSCFTTESDHKMTIQNFVIYICQTHETGGICILVEPQKTTSNSFPKPDEAVNGWSLTCAKLRDFACVVFGLSGFPSRKENGLISSRFLREKQND
jgi:hypothetical protein